MRMTQLSMARHLRPEVTLFLLQISLLIWNMLSNGVSPGLSHSTLPRPNFFPSIIIKEALRFPLFKWLKPLSMKLHALTGFWVSNSLQILSRIHTFFLLPKKQGWWLVLSFEPGISLHLLLFTISTRAKSVRGWSTVVTFGLALPNALFPVWIECNVECVGS